MKIVIDIPDSKIPSEQELLSICMLFIDGQVGECTYPFQELSEVFEDIKAEIEHIIPCDKEALSVKLGVLEIIDKYISGGKAE